MRDSKTPVEQPPTQGDTMSETNCSMSYCFSGNLAQALKLLDPNKVVTQCHCKHNS